MLAAAKPCGPFEVQRRWKRYRIRVPVRLVIHRNDLTARVTGCGTGFNEGGMCVFADVELNLGDRIELEFTPPYASAPLRIWAAVRNRYGCFYGLEYITENDADYNNVGQLEAIPNTLGSTS
jgi:hypothetical protein